MSFFKQAVPAVSLINQRGKSGEIQLWAMTNGVFFIRADSPNRRSRSISFATFKMKLALSFGPLPSGKTDPNRPISGGCDSNHPDCQHLKIRVSQISRSGKELKRNLDRTFVRVATASLNSFVIWSSASVSAYPFSTLCWREFEVEKKFLVSVFFTASHQERRLSSLTNFATHVGFSAAFFRTFSFEVCFRSGPGLTKAAMLFLEAGVLTGI